MYFVISGNVYANFAAYQAAVAPKEAASVTTDPAFIGQPRNGDLRVSSTSPAYTVKAGASYQELDPTTEANFLLEASGY
jgi:hypothetical protein